MEILQLRIFAIAKFRSCECSLRRNFASVDAKFGQDDSEISFDLTRICERFATKFRRIFARTKNEKHRISFAFLLHGTVRPFFFVLIGQKLTGEFMWKIYAASCPLKLVY